MQHGMRDASRSRAGSIPGHELVSHPRESSATSFAIHHTSVGENERVSTTPPTMQHHHKFSKLSFLRAGLACPVPALDPPFPLLALLAASPPS